MRACVCVCVPIAAVSAGASLQTSFFFGYNAMIAFGVFLMLGTVGFFSALRFVRYIYSSIKVE